MIPARPFVANSKPGRQLLLCLLSLVFAVSSLWVIVWGIGDAEYFLLGLAGVLVFGAAAIVLLVRVMATGPEVRVDANGIWLRRTARDTIPWDAIRGITIAETGGRRVLCLDLAGSALIGAGVAVGTSKAPGSGDASIDMTGTDRNVDELVAAVRGFAPPSLRTVGPRPERPGSGA